MAFDAAALKTELQNDPQSLGYANLAQAARDQAIADLLNAPGAGLVPLTEQTKNLFLRITTPAAIRLAVGVGTDNQQLEALAVAKWKTVLEQARAADPGSSINVSLVGANAPLGDPVADKVMTSDEFLALTNRVGSRAEVLFGAGVVVTAEQVGAAR